MFRLFTIAVAAGCMALAGCSKDKPTAPAVTSTVYLGALYDSVLALALSHVPNMNYSASQYRYTLKSDNSFMVDENVGMGWTSAPGEEGTYSVSGDTFSFTPTVNRKDNPAKRGEMISVDSLRPAYTAVLANDSLTIPDFLNIDDRVSQRNLHTLVLKKQ